MDIHVLFYCLKQRVFRRHIRRKAVLIRRKAFLYCRKAVVKAGRYR